MVRTERPGVPDSFCEEFAEQEGLRMVVKRVVCQRHLLRTECPVPLPIHLENGATIGSFFADCFPHHARHVVRPQMNVSYF